MEQTNINEQQKRLSKWTAQLDEHGTQSNLLRAQLNKQQKRLNRLKTLSNKLEAYCDARHKTLCDIRDNIIKVKMELYSSQTEDVNATWNLCDKLRELIYNEDELCTKLYKNECKYYDCGNKIEKYEYMIEELHDKINSCVFDVNDLIKYVSKYAPKLAKTLIKYKSKYNFNLTK